MNITFENPGVGRYIVDIDGCLRATNARVMTVDEIIALHGRLAGDATLVHEDNGESIPLARHDRVEFSEDKVAFFRSCAGPRLFRGCAIPASGAARWRDGRPAAVSALAA